MYSLFKRYISRMYEDSGGHEFYIGKVSVFIIGQPLCYTAFKKKDITNFFHFI